MAEQKTVATPSAEVEEMRPDWALADALLGGTRAMRAAGETYLPRWPNEERAEYLLRLNRSVLFPAYKRTVQTLAAKPFSKPITLEDGIPSEFEPWLQNIDLQGRNLDVFAADCMQTMLAKGLGGILVEYPVAGQEVRTQADEQAAGLRPYWVHIKPGCILGWKARPVNGEWRLLQLRLMEEVEVDDGEFGTAEIDQVRVLEPGRWRTYRQNDKKEWVQFGEGVMAVAGKPLEFIPFVPLYGDREGFMEACPPLIEVAHLNVAHWQSASDQQHILHVARVPILCAVNVQDPLGPNGEVKPWELTIGASTAARITGQDVDLKFVEHSGKAIEAGSNDLKDLEDRMRQAGAELLVIGPAANTRIEAAADNEVATCALQRLTLSLQDALNTALDYTARWRGIAEGGGSVKLFSDFGALTLGAAESQMITDAANAGILSKETAFEELQRRGVVSGERTWDDEQERLDAQGPALGALPDPMASNGGAGGSGAA